MKKTKTRQGIIKAFNAAIEGIIYTFKFERNMKIHYFLAVVVLTASLFLGLDRFEMILLVFAISLVVIAEMFNTAIEKTIDMITDEYHVLAKIAKDVAAGGVLIAALNSAVVGYLLFYNKLTELSDSVLKTITNTFDINLYCFSINSCCSCKSYDINRNTFKGWDAKWSYCACICYSNSYNFFRRKSSSFNFSIFNGSISCTK